MRSILLVVCLAFCGAGCASNTSQEDLDARRWAQEIRILEPEDVGDRPYDVLAELDERVRIGPMGEEDAISEAERSMRLRAAKVDADAVVMSGCRRLTSRDDFQAGSNPTIRCVGYAVRWITY